jgi:cyclase
MPPVPARIIAATPLVLILAALAAPTPAPAQQSRLSELEFTTTDLGDGLYMVNARFGGNIGLSVGPDATFLIDDQYAPLTPKLEAAIATITDRPVRFVVNTHWHGDHTGGNENLGKAGAVIVAHDNVRRRMSTAQISEAYGDTTPASPHPALPVLTFADAVTFHLNGHEVAVTHHPAGHTDGDAVVRFREANVVHMGDLFFNGTYPFIDLESGGSAAGVLRAVDSVLADVDDATRIIPGHGALATRADLVAYRDMLTGTIEAVRSLVAQGKSREEVVAAKPTASWDATWGGGFMKPDAYAGSLYDSLERR